jgi:hypothetical protein
MRCTAEGHEERHRHPQLRPGRCDPDCPRDGDAIVRPFEAGMALWKAGFYVRFGGDTLQFGPTFNSKPQDLDRLFDAVGEVLNKID